jgi:hypothetical protein
MDLMAFGMLPFLAAPETCQSFFVGFCTTSSTKLFHASHEGHLPNHFADS